MSVIVVGGGIAGIVSALLIREQFDTVYLIEKEPELGGLLRSFQNEDGLSFDYGSHFLRDTGIEALDRLLYGDFSPEQWQTMGNLKGGGYYGFQYNGDSAFLDTRVLPKKLYHQGIIQLLNACEKPSTTYSNLEDRYKEEVLYLETELSILVFVFATFSEEDYQNYLPVFDQLITSFNYRGNNPKPFLDWQKQQSEN